MNKIVEIWNGPWYWRYLIPVYVVLFVIGLGLGVGIAELSI